LQRKHVKDITDIRRSVNQAVEMLRIVIIRPIHYEYRIHSIQKPINYVKIQK